MTEREANRTNVELDDREASKGTLVRNRAKREEYSSCQPEDGYKPYFTDCNFKETHKPLIVTILTLVWKHPVRNGG